MKLRLRSQPPPPPLRAPPWLSAITTRSIIILIPSNSSSSSSSSTSNTGRGLVTSVASGSFCRTAKAARSTRVSKIVVSSRLRHVTWPSPTNDSGRRQPAPTTAMTRMTCVMTTGVVDVGCKRRSERVDRWTSTSPARPPTVQVQTEALPLVWEDRQSAFQTNCLNERRGLAGCRICHQLVKNNGKWPVLLHVYLLFLFCVHSLLIWVLHLRRSSTQ